MNTIEWKTWPYNQRPAWTNRWFKGQSWFPSFLEEVRRTISNERDELENIIVRCARKHNRQEFYWRDGDLWIKVPIDSRMTMWLMKINSNNQTF